jgi:hypothetical protein
VIQLACGGAGGDPGGKHRSEVTMKARTALLICLFGLVAPAAAGCTGGVNVRYPAFPDRTCATCAGSLR